MLHSAFATGLGLVVSPKRSLPLAYRGVPAVTGQRGALIGDSRVVAFALPTRVPPCILFRSPRGDAIDSELSYGRGVAKSFELLT